MRYAKVNQLLLRGVFEGSVGIAPHAVVLVKGAVRLFTGDGIFKRHAAALADQLPRRAKKRIDRHVKERGKQLERFDIRRGFTGITYLKILVSFNQFCR